MSAGNSADLRHTAGRASISRLMVLTFLVGLLIAAIAVYSAYSSYRISAVRTMAQAEAQRIAHLVFENLYSVMRKGWTRAEIDDVVHHIQLQLPDYEVLIVRGEPVVRQFGDRPGQSALRSQDPELRAVLETGEESFLASDHRLRHIFPVRMSSECSACHQGVRVGDTNGAIIISVPLASLEGPIAQIAHPVMYITLALISLIFGATLLVMRNRVAQPIVDLAEHVNQVSNSHDFRRELVSAPHWPAEVGSLAGHFNTLLGEVRDSHAQLMESSIRDPLTNCFNRRHFDSVLTQAVLDAAGKNHNFALLLIDLDRFKPINDEHGHAAGDTVLLAVASTLHQTVRETDVVARIGGDEFVIFAPETNITAAHDLARRIKTAVSDRRLRIGHQFVRPSCSIGVACYPDHAHEAGALLTAADAAMYADKKSSGHSR